ncbi:hypothetical protein JXI42_01470 [bacterium]|nr:hypothetical protein [bacterium]
MLKSKVVLPIFLTLIFFSRLMAQAGGDLLNETPFHSIPGEMTFDEYRDANRRVSLALLFSSIPIPGMVHFYGGEERTGWWLVGASALGITSIITGAALIDESETYKETDYVTVDLDGIRYEMIPYEIEESVVKYKLKKLEKDSEMGLPQVALITTGILLIGGEIVYDWIHGIKVIEEKRDRVRYKYGKQVSLGFEPGLDLKNKSIVANLVLSF